MSGTNTPRSLAPAPKQMSSRLLTMKFMQRAAAASPQSPNTPNSSLQSPSEPSTKKRKLDYSSQIASPATPNGESYADRAAISAALKAEADAQAKARARNMKEGCETEWILDSGLPASNGNISKRDMNGHVKEDAKDEDESESDDIWSAGVTGRQTYGDFKRKQSKPVPKTDEQDDEELSSASESDPEPGGRQSHQRAPGNYSRENNAKTPRRQQSYNSYGSPLTSLGRDRGGQRQQYDHSGQRKKSRKSK